MVTLADFFRESSCSRHAFLENAFIRLMSCTWIRLLIFLVNSVNAVTDAGERKLKDHFLEWMNYGEGMD